MIAETWVVLIRCAPGQPDSREMLELVLAGASLEIELIVVFSGEGRRHLIGEEADAWRQLADFQLAGMRYTIAEAETFSPALPAEAASVDEIDRLCRQARGVIEL